MEIRRERERQEIDTSSAWLRGMYDTCLVSFRVQRDGRVNLGVHTLLRRCKAQSKTRRRRGLRSDTTGLGEAGDRDGKSLSSNVAPTSRVHLSLLLLVWEEQLESTFLDIQIAISQVLAWRIDR